MLVLVVNTDIGFRILFEGLGSIEEARPLLVFHGNRGVTTIVYHPHSIPVCLSIVYHKYLEFGLWNTMPCHDIIEVLPKYHLSSTILWLRIVDYNGHDMTICGVIDMASHGGPMRRDWTWSTRIPDLRWIAFVWPNVPWIWVPLQTSWKQIPRRSLSLNLGTCSSKRRPNGYSL